MVRSVLLGVFALSLLSAPLMAQEAVYSRNLEEFAYPHTVAHYDFTSQHQELRMAYMDVPANADTKNGRVVVLLHGKNFCAATWDGTIEALSTAGYRVIAPDQVGFCKSDKPEGYQFSFAQLAANTHGLLTSLGIERATIIGHSIGGMLAARYALQYPDATEQLVMVNPIGLEDWQAKGVPYADIDTLYAGELNTSFDGIKAYQQRMYYNGDWKPEYDRWVDMLAGMYKGEGREIVAYNQAQTSEMLFTQPVVQEFGFIKPPTLLLIGMLDRTAPGANRAPDNVAAALGYYPALSESAEAAIPNATLVAFDDLGHSPHIESPELFYDALLSGLEQAP